MRRRNDYDMKNMKKLKIQKFSKSTRSNYQTGISDDSFMY